jgi:PAB-dependent poly(A)-specific ribonuclease subunit 3
VTKHLSSLSLDTPKKTTTATITTTTTTTTTPEFLLGRSVSNSNSTSPNIFNNSYHSQENVGGTTYFYVQNPVVDPTITVVDGNEIVSKIIQKIVSKYYTCFYLLSFLLFLHFIKKY